VLGLVLNEVVAVREGFLSTLTTVPVWIAQSLITCLLVFSYVNARKL
jgi:hypothetical protein